MNLNKLARDITIEEGGKINLSIAQVKEVMRILLSTLAALPLEEVAKIILKYKK